MLEGALLAEVSSCRRHSSRCFEFAAWGGERPAVFHLATSTLT
jgi:hypothetical protein